LNAPVGPPTRQGRPREALRQTQLRWLLRLSFATLAMFLGRNCIFDSTLRETWLSLRRTGAGGSNVSNLFI
jgi:hypothetical protein